jgi:hypothetical protein
MIEDEEEDEDEDEIESTSHGRPLARNSHEAWELPH